MNKEIDAALAHLSANDPVMRELILRHKKPTLEKHTQYYEQIVSSIIGQQLSVYAARAIFEKFKALYGGDFPTPEQVIITDLETIKSAGLGKMKASYVQDLAQKVIDGVVTFDAFDEMTNDEIVSELIKVKGIGEWTAHMFLIFAMARLDVLPTGDLGVRNAITKLYGFSEPATPEQMKTIAEKNNWHPYETIASLYTWRSLDNVPDF